MISLKKPGEESDDVGLTQQRRRIMKKTGFLVLLMVVLGTLTVRAQASGDDMPPPDYVPYDKAPEPVKIVQPQYPAAAVQTGVEGTVWIKIWVGKDGKAKKAVVSKSEWPVLNQPSVDAALQWIFSPATIRNVPVDVWVNVPFKFRKSRS